jgi:hypothetical protein
MIDECKICKRLKYIGFTIKTSIALYKCSTLRINIKLTCFPWRLLRLAMENTLAYFAPLSLTTKNTFYRVLNYSLPYKTWILPHRRRGQIS